MIPVHHLFTTLGSWTLVHVGPEEGRVVPLWLPQVLNQGLSHQCTCFSYMREAGALT